jgi:hypothetical protein
MRGWAGKMHQYVLYQGWKRKLYSGEDPIRRIRWRRGQVPALVFSLVRPPVLPGYLMGIPTAGRVRR